ncbi:MAG: LuxR C-terminal-related transcriptional regulator [Trueperaceae bacterium]
MNRISVIFADHHPLVRTGVRATLALEPDLRLVAEAQNGPEALNLIKMHLPDVFLFYLNTPGLHPLETVQAVQAVSTHTKLVVLAPPQEATLIYPMVRAGIAGYLLEHESTDVLVNAIRTVYQGGNWFSKEVLAALAQNPEEMVRSGVVADLTDRELSILFLIAEGKTNHGIAKELSLAEQTVRNYVSRIYDKVDLHSRSELIVWTREQGLMIERQPSRRPIGQVIRINGDD